MIFPLSFLDKCECFWDGNSHDGIHTKDVTILFFGLIIGSSAHPTTKWTTIKTKLYLFVNGHLHWHGWSSYIQKQKNMSFTKKIYEKRMNFMQENLGQI
jgi:hypothetical protein